MKINISSNETAPLKSITENIDTRYADSLVTVLISKKEGSMTFIAGKPPYVHIVHLYWIRPLHI